MSFSFSQPQTSSFLDPNELLNLQTLRDAPQVAADIHQNRLLAQQQAQQESGSLARYGRQATPRRRGPRRILPIWRKPARWLLATSRTRPLRILAMRRRRR
jgi:hypothetical protein